MNTLRCYNVHVIACDLDDTLVATHKHTASSRREGDEALTRLGSLITDLRAQNNQPIYFGSATGRTFGSIQELATERPAFRDIFNIMDFHIASVGAAIYVRRNNTADFTRLTHWPDPQSWDRAALVDRLSAHPDLMLQEPEAQDTYKISYNTKNSTDTPTHVTGLNAYLGAVNLRANVIVSGGGSWQFVDVLPIGTDKGRALLQLPDLLENPLPEDSICRVAAGDSMNDESSLAVADVAIIPGNAQPDLLDWGADLRTGSLYVADEYFAAGVLQGIQKHLYGN